MPPKLCDPDFLGVSSFLDVLAGKQDDPIFSELRVSSFRGISSLLISEQEISVLAASFEFSLVEFFPYMRPSLDSIRQFFFNLKLNGEFSVTLLDQSHIIIKIKNDLDCCRVFCHGSYLVYSCFMKLTKWLPYMDIGVESPVVPIWVSFHLLRPHLFSPRILHGLGLIFGKPLKIDTATAIGSRTSLARVLVELDVTKSYPARVWLGPESSGYVQHVALEDFPSFCSSCKKFGHFSGNCCPEVDLSMPSKVAKKDSIVSDPILPSSNVEVEQVFSVEPILQTSALDAQPVVQVVDLDTPQANLAVENVEIDVVNNVNLSGGKDDGGEGVAVLSPDALPFLPQGSISGNLDPLMVSPRTCLSVDNYGGADRLLSVVSAPAVLGEISFKSVLLDCPHEDAALRPDNLGAEVCEVFAHSSSHPVLDNCLVNNNYVDVPVTLIDPQSLVYYVGDNSRLDVRVQMDWLQDSSYSDSDSFESSGDEDQGNSFALLRDKPIVYIASRGRTRGRGRRGR
ncbi:hypothetical protein KFK09_013216 [Dendrobium nobile]|uniref:DUF4283 domain-containing protein n=1 Tax=Dendrobium nobile TaxID=94219 RepID=A0A8T3B8D0_DENNO|nr:hypothetical protein KFK09_013216 [Dendrobium nobile]